MPIDIEGVIGQGLRYDRWRDGPCAAGRLAATVPLHAGARHNWKRLQWIADIAVLLDKATSEQQRWMAAARRKSLMNPVMQGIRLAEITLGIPRPAGAPEGEGSFALRTMVSRHARRLRSVKEGRDEIDEARARPRHPLLPHVHDGRLAYQWQEVRRGVHSLATHLSGGARA